MGRSAKTVAIIGAGMAGLAAAIDLAARGVRVVVMERDTAPGGKMREVEVAGRRIDARRIVVYHHQQDEDVPEIQGRELPSQGNELVFRKD